jgi:hypothetical protein
VKVKGSGRSDHT